MADGPSIGRRWYAALLGLVFVAALLTRLIGLGGAVTEDEDQWIARSGTFAHGLATGSWQRTYLTGHPGVTVMWLTTSALGIARAQPFERTSGSADVTTVPDFLPALERARVPFAVLQAGLVVLAAALVGRLLGRAIGLTAGLLLTAEPFWSGVGPIVGMDGQLSGFLTVALLALLLACGLGGSPASGPPGGAHHNVRAEIGWTFLSGAAFGLAFLTKTTALVAGPMVPALALLAGWLAWRSRRPARWWLLPVRIGGVWLLAAGLVVWAVWPAAWFTPVNTIVRAITFSASLGNTPHAPGNFLLGQPVEEPGPLFYPVALVVRIGPATMLGLLLLFVFGVAAPLRRALWPLLGYVALFLLLLTVAAKKVDRYLLPVLPVLGILAAVGWMELGRRAPTWLARLRRGAGEPAAEAHATAGAGQTTVQAGQSMVQAAQGTGARTSVTGATSWLLAAGLVAFAVQLWPILLAGRYPLAAYNPLVGGARTAEQAIPVGWGDGLDMAGAKIREMAGGRTVTTAIWSPLRVNFGAHAPGPVVSDRQLAQADYFVDYIHARQRRLTPRQLVNQRPAAVVTIGGVDYARIYRLR